jgi:hypothetical protein
MRSFSSTTKQQFSSRWKNGAAQSQQTKLMLKWHGIHAPRSQIVKPTALELHKQQPL